MIVIATLAWWSAHPIVVGSARRRSGEARARVVGRGALDCFARLDTLVVDPIGSVTVGELRVIGVEPLDPEHDRSLRWFAGALQHGADDPVARAISRLSARGGATNVEHLPGVGVLGTVDRHPVRVGSPEWIGLDGVPDDDWAQTVAVEVDGRALGRIRVADVVREQSAATIASLAADGVQVVLVAPGDAAARHLSSLLPGATTVAPSERPGEQVVDDSVREGAGVATVGRGRSAIVRPVTGTVAVSDDLGTDVPGVEMHDVAIHHVATVLRLLRSARGRVRAMRIGVIAVTVVGVAGLLLVPTGPPELAATAATVLALPVAVLLPLLRWS
ncbi:hypothetical protein GCM10009710_24410 [Aeromicrobium alkaliterrae]|uniref:HAD family hydrolase n=1 Tax=Aeromicrobium alkaliterrae TaxID=302168 RepID=A0ABN2JY95_9ACTN